MRMWKMKVSCMLLCLIATGCAGPRFNLDEGAGRKILEMPGRIQVEFDAWGKYWHYSIVKGEMLLQSMKDSPPARFIGDQPYIHFPREIPKGLPQIQGFEYHGPYRLSPDNTLMALSLSLQGHYSPVDFVLIEMATKEALFQRRSEKKHSIDGIAWSPDSSLFAVMEASSRLSLRPSGILFYTLAHPVTMDKYYLSIYDRKGKLLVHTVIASGLRNASGRVLWEEGKQ
jgi:hypothetical protein